MKGLLLSWVSALVFVGVGTLAVRVYRGRKYFHLFLIELPFVGLLYGLLFYVLPADLYFLPPHFLEPSSRVDFVNGLFSFLLLFHILWDAAYAMVLTGLSSEIFVRLFRKKGGLSLEEFVKEFRGDEEIDDILEWRIPNLLNSKYVYREGDSFCLSKKGRWVANIGLFFKRLFKMDVEG